MLRLDFARQGSGVLLLKYACIWHESVLPSSRLSGLQVSHSCKTFTETHACNISGI